MKQNGTKGKGPGMHRYLKTYEALCAAMFALTSLRLTMLNKGLWETTSHTLAGIGHNITLAEAFLKSLLPSIQFAFLGAWIICMLIAILRKMCTGSIDW